MKLNNVQITPLDNLQTNSLIVVNELYVNENEEVCSRKKVIDVYELVESINELVAQNKKLTDIVLKLSQHVRSGSDVNIIEKIAKIEQILDENLLVQ
jgi:hypothetical protein